MLSSAAATQPVTLAIFDFALLVDYYYFQKGRVTMYLVRFRPSFAHWTLDINCLFLDVLGKTCSS